MKRTSITCASIVGFLLLVFAFPGGAGAQDQTQRALTHKKVGRTPEEAGKQGVQLWALIIGISNYEYGDQTIAGMTISNLAYATTDARAVYDFLQSDAGGGFRDVSKGGHMILLTDEEATKANIERELDNLKEAKPDDYFVIYWAGHGHIVTQKIRGSTTEEDRDIPVPYFVTRDTNPKNFKGTAVDMGWFREVVENKIQAMRGLVLLDTCHSGGIMQPGMRGGELANNAFISELGKIKGIGFITAADALEYSFEKAEFDHGVFTYCLLEALRGAADEDQDGKVNFKEAYAFLRDRVPKLTEDKQHPYPRITWLRANEIPLSIVRYSGSQSGAGKYGTLVIRNPVDGVEVAIDDEPSQSAAVGIEVSTQVQAGPHTISYSQKGTSKSKLQVTVEPGKTKEVEIKLCFSESGEQDSSRDLPTSVYLSDKEPPQQAVSVFQEGVDNFNKQKFKEAIDRFNDAIKLSGGAYSRALVYRGRSEQLSGRPDAAVNTFTEALRLKPTDFETRTMLAEAQFEVGGDIKGTYDTLREVTTTYPTYAFAHVVLGDVLLWKGQTVRAERELRRAVALDPKSPPAHLILADALTYQPTKEKRKEAIEEAATALRLFEELAQKRKSFRGLSISHLIFGGGRYANAPAMAEAHYILAKVLTRAVDYDPEIAERKVYLDQARASLQEATKLALSLRDNVRQAQVMITSAQNYLLAGDLKSAISDGEKAFRLSESSRKDELKAQVYLMLSRVYRSNQECAKAARHLASYIGLYKSRMTSAEYDQNSSELEHLKNCANANRQH